MKKYIIDEDLLHGLIDYLITRPYKEVAGAVPKLMELPLYEPKEVKDERN